MLALYLAACSTGATVLDETFTADNGLSAPVAIVVPEQTGDKRPLGVLLYFSADFDNA